MPSRFESCVSIDCYCACCPCNVCKCSVRQRRLPGQASCLLMRGKPSLHRQLQRMLLITHMGSLPAGMCCSCRESCQGSRQAPDRSCRKRAEGGPGGSGGAAAGAGSGDPAGADKVWNQCMSLNVATAGGHVWPCWLGQTGHCGATVLQRAEFVAMLLLLPSALIVLSQVAVQAALWICTCLYACAGSVCQSHMACGGRRGLALVMRSGLNHECFTRCFKSPHQPISLHNVPGVPVSLPAGLRMSSASSALPPSTAFLPRRSRA